ncbi:hypothetical protein LXL04_022553 [Taraxacum kok-saghyz]
MLRGHHHLPPWSRWPVVAVLPEYDTLDGIAGVLSKPEEKGRQKTHRKRRTKPLGRRQDGNSRRKGREFAQRLFAAESRRGPVGMGLINEENPARKKPCCSAVVHSSELGRDAGDSWPRERETAKILSGFCCKAPFYIAGITDRSLTRVHVCVVTEIEGSIPRDTAAITSSQLRRSNRGGFTLRYIMMCLHDYD